MPIILDGDPANAGNPIYGYADWSDAAALSCTSTVEGTNVLANLQTEQPSSIASLAASSMVTIIADRGTSEPWNALFLLYHNLTSSAVVRVRSADTLLGTTAAPQVDSGNLVAWGDADYRRWARRHSWWFPPIPFLGPTESDAIESRFLRIEITDMANPDGFIRIGRLIAGAFTQFSRAQQLGRSKGYNDKSKITDTVDGRKIPTPASPRPVQKFSVKCVGHDAESELEAFSDNIERIRGASRSVLIMVRPNMTAHAHRNLVYGLLELGPQTKEDDFQQYEQAISIEGLT